MWAPTGAEAAAFDRRAIEELGSPHHTLMENAGRAAAAVLDRLYPRGPVVGVLGAGNNGGDGIVLLRTLAAWGRSVRAILAADRDDDRDLLHGWSLDIQRGAFRNDEPEGTHAASLENAAVVVDGVLGTGVRGAPRARQARSIVAMNASGAPVLALDIPSGVDADTGATPGETVRAEVTVAFGWPKLGSLFHPGRALVGRLVAVEIGFPAVEGDAFAAALITPSWAHARRPRRDPDTHKNAVGSLFLLAGSRGMAGAALLAARSALRSGVGLLRLASSRENREIVQAGLPEAIFVDATDQAAVQAAVAASSALAVGPGLGRGGEAVRALEITWEAGDTRPVVMDADALNLTASGSAPSIESVAKDRPLLITPHPGEMERLSGMDRDRIVSRRPDVAREVAARLGCHVLLKGLPSVVASPVGSLLVGANGTSDLAMAGMGDVLTGAVGGFLAQGAAPSEAGALALHYTGRAAALAARGAGLVPGDVIRYIPDALAESGPGTSDLALPFVTFDQDPAR